jgi:hypothetical protein
MKMGLDEAAWDGFSRGSPIRRAGRVDFLRKVAVALGNWGSREAVPVLASARGCIGSPEACRVPEERLPLESDSGKIIDMKAYHGPSDVLE